jgi:uncharacterized paraquat-inducible protein A
MTKALIDRLKIGCFGLDPIDPLRVLLDEVIEALAQPEQEPVAWMEMVTANLVREGVNKHKARELAEHFYSLSQSAQQEPATRPCRSCGGSGERNTGIDEAPTSICKPCSGTGQISTNPPAQRTWVPLMDDEIDYIMAFVNPHCNEIDFARAIEAKLKEKNT